MRTYESNEVSIKSSSEKVFRTLSDLNNLEKFMDKIPEDRRKDFSFDKDSICIHTDQMGDVSLHITEREHNKSIQFSSKESMIDFHFLVSLEEKDVSDTRAKVALSVDLNPIMASMVESPIRESLDKMADFLSTLPYDKID
ncbi:MAG TPA: polyketide cyclase [Porphyromonadaceae bacterium]|nr:polyketide cyclase [Porphyromonadaceae bacterium]